MKYLTLVPRVLWKCWLSLNFGIGMLLLYPFFRLLLSRSSSYPAAFRLMRSWAYFIAFTSGIYPRIQRMPSMEKGPCVYCANHHSYLDILMSYIVIPHYFIFMGKREIQNTPLFNVFFRGMNILVDRKSNVDSHKAFLRAGEELQKGNSIFIFPEGGIIFRDQQLHRFKNGAFRLAIEKQVPVVPITYLNNIHLLQTGSFLMADARPGIARVIVHEPIPTKGMGAGDLVSLREKCYQVIDEALRK
ncbi:MAG: 1-acyl-sn-glycerol-3-phosphate acyltransferase [Bacteroidia bacterium]|nr:1-acyl-sn-glycerol-3-phosphate acyltransferase [Bacteroidia bacterium]